MYASKGATIPRSEAFDAVTGRHNQVAGDIPEGLRNAIVMAPLIDDLAPLQVKPHCPGERCSWRFSSLTIGHRCVNLTHQVKEKCHGDSCDYTLPHGLARLHGPEAQFSTETTMAFYNSPLFANITQPLSNVIYIAKPYGGGLESVRSYQCVEYPEAAEYSSHFEKGALHEEIVTRWHNTTDHIPTSSKMKNDSNFISLSPGGLFGSANFTIGQKSWVAPQYNDLSYFSGSIVSNIVQPGANEVLTNLLYHATLDGTLDGFYAKRDLAIATYMRTHDSLRSHADGTAFTPHEIFHITWGWVALPIVVSLTALSLAIIICVRARCIGTDHLRDDAEALIRVAPRDMYWPADFDHAGPYRLDRGTDRFVPDPPAHPLVPVARQQAIRRSLITSPGAWVKGLVWRSTAAVQDID